MTFSPVNNSTLQADILVCGGSFGAPAAALAAARSNPDLRVVLAEPMEWLGGQATSQGVSAIDNAWHDPAKAQMRDEPESHYAADYLEWLNLMRDPGPTTPGFGLSPDGTCWVSRESYDPRTAAWALDQMCARYPNLQVLHRTVVKALETLPDTAHPGHRRITELTLIRRTPAGTRAFPRFLSAEWPDWFQPHSSEWYDKEVVTVLPVDSSRGMVVIDASETSDAIVLSGAEYTLGRELETEDAHPDGSPPAMDEAASQATVFCFCMTGAVPDSGRDSLTELRKKLDTEEFENYIAEQEKEFYSLGSHGFHRVWTYRRLKAEAPLNDWDQVAPGDVTMQNWNPGNDYPHASIFKTRTQVAEEITGEHGWQGGLHLDHVAQAEKHALGFFLHMAHLCREKAGFEATLPRGAHRYNMMGTWNGLAAFPYIRCGRRLIGLDGFRITQDTFADSQGDGRSRTSQRFFDSVGIGSYASDVHPIKGSEGVGCSVHLPSGFHIPYRALASRNISNLLSGCKSMAATYWVNSAYRLHPIEWAAGSAAGVAAAHLAEEGLTNDALLEPARLVRLQTAVAANSPIHWRHYDEDPLPNRRGDVIVNGLRTIKAGQTVDLRIDAPGAAEALVESDGPGLHVALTLNLVRGAARGKFSVPASLGEKARSLSISVHVRALKDAASDPVDFVTIPVAGLPLQIPVGDSVSLRPGESGLSLTGDAWTLLPGDTAWTTDGAMPGRVATYAFPTLPVGTYALEMEWPAHENAASDTPLLLSHGRTEKFLRVDQTVLFDIPREVDRLTLEAEAPVRIMINNDVSDPIKSVLAGHLRLRRLA